MLNTNKQIGSVAFSLSDCTSYLQLIESEVKGLLKLLIEFRNWLILKFSYSEAKEIQAWIITFSDWPKLDSKFGFELTVDFQML